MIQIIDFEIYVNKKVEIGLNIHEIKDNTNNVNLNKDIKEV
ncbi:MAG: hypothetical protein N4A48_04490 [Tepidibacter sp.]|nr:hypothetical protein [Tepidibacter sp.]MCT4508010.1 hypothetical protein [Tepidibacter sp.]